MSLPLETKIEEMSFVVAPWGERESTRIKNALQRNGIMTLGDLVQRRWSDLGPGTGIGIVLRGIIHKKLKGLGLKLVGL